jgi:hypothetical protein
VDVDWDPTWERTVARIVEPAVDQAGQAVEAEQRRLIPVSADGSYGRPPGYARDLINTEARTEDGLPVRDVGSDALTPDGTSYPSILAVGSRAHDIISHGDYPLRNRTTGQVFGRRVRHPGTRPIPWLQNSILVLQGREFR